MQKKGKKELKNKLTNGCVTKNFSKHSARKKINNDSPHTHTVKKNSSINNLNN